MAPGTSASDSPDLLLRAEAADVSRKAGSGPIILFAEAMRVKAMGRLDTELALRESIKRGWIFAFIISRS